MYYTINQLAAELNVSPHTIYAWRKKGVLPPPVGGRRYARWTPEHLRIGRAIKKIVHDDKTTLQDLAERLTPPRDE